MANWYCGSTKYTSVAAWAATTTYTVGNIVRQLATPSVGNERCFRVSAISTGTSGSSEPSWTLTKNGTTTDSGVTWTECTGQASYNGDGGGSAWAAPHARIGNALASGWMAAGDVCYVSNNHAETQASQITITSGAGTKLNPISVICASDTSSPPTSTASTATVSTTGANDIQVSGGSCYWYGINFYSGSGSNTGSILPGQNSGWCYFDTCSFNINNTSSSSFFQPTIVNNSSQTDDFIFFNCSVTFGATSQGFFANAVGTLKGTFISCYIASSGSVPTSLISAPSYTSRAAFLKFRDTDLSAITGTIFDASVQAGLVFGSLLMQNCKLGAGVTLFNYSGANTFGNQSLYDFFVRSQNSDSSSTNYNYYYINQLGAVKQETTVVRTNGATDGVTPISWNFTTSSSASFYRPFISEEIAQWNTLSSGSHTATIYLTSNTTLSNNQVWFELEYAGTSGYPLGVVGVNKAAILATPASLTTDSISTWGGSTTNKYKINITFSPKNVGPIKARILVAAPSTTIYIDPYIYIT